MQGSLILSTILFLITSCNPPKKTVWLLDTETYLTQIQIDRLDSLYKSHAKKTTNEIALVLTPDYGMDTSLLFFAVTFGREHEIGSKEKANGVIIAFCGPKNNVSIATGYGTEKVLTDEIAKKIIDSVMIPNFKQGEIFKGLWGGSKAVVEFLEKPENKIK